MRPQATITASVASGSAAVRRAPMIRPSKFRASAADRTPSRWYAASGSGSTARLVTRTAQPGPLGSKGLT